MSKETISDLISTLHDKYGDELTSEQQMALMAQLKLHMHDVNEAVPEDPSLRDTVEMFLTEVEEDHPQAAQVVRQIMDVLNNIGV